ncbi:MAG: carboxymuconolactone decarboxylase family protein [Pseudomonadota bacterium]
MSKESYTTGLARRRQVMGDVFVDRAMDSASDFTRPLQDMVTANCWGETWDRDDLPLATRSLITISILTALRASTELKGHIRGALNNGCSVEEIRGALLHATVYCGFPAGIEAFRAADEVIQTWQEAN